MKNSSRPKLKQKVTPEPRKKGFRSLVDAIANIKVNWPLLGALLITATSIVLTIRPHLTPLDIPYGDGNWYISRAMLLHGVLHDGQWHKFWELLLAPSTVTLLPAYVLYWLTPTAWASAITYGLIHTVAWHLLLLLGAWGLLRELGQPRLLPAVMLLTLANNNILDFTLYYYIDMNFAASALVALWLLMRAIRSQARGAIILAGAVAGLLLFVKPGNTFIFMGCYAVTLVVFWGMQWCATPRADRGTWFRGVVRLATCWIMGFLPVFMLACGWTLIPSVVLRIIASSSDFWAPEPMSNPLLRLFYYPLCLSYYYSFVLLAGCATVVGLLACWVPVLKGSPTNSMDKVSIFAMMGLASGYIIVWGLGFSFVLGFKIIRSLPLMLPILWICIFCWISERWRLTRALTLFAVLYFGVAHAQFVWGLAGEKQNRGTEDYTLKGDWLNRLPAQAPALEAPATLTRSLLDTLSRLGVTHGRVAVGTEMLYWNNVSLNWLVKVPFWLKGERPSLEFDTMVDHQGKPIVSAIKGATAFMLMIHPSIQYSPIVYEFNVKTAQYAEKKWKGGLARRMEILSLADGRPAVVIVVFNKPLTDAELSEYLKANFQNRRSEFVERENLLMERRMTLREYWSILEDARQKKVKQDVL